jgi:hypothetical protein
MRPRSTVALPFAVLFGAAVLAAPPQPPRERVDTDLVATPGRVIPVPAGGNLQAALDEAIPGDVIALAAGSTFTGAFVLPAKRGDGWIVLRTDAPDGDLPPRGTRLSPEAAPRLAKIVAAGQQPALATQPGAHHYRIVGLEITVAPGVPRNYGLVTIGTFDQSSPGAIPHHVVLDRVYVHGRPDGNVRRGVALNGAWSALIDSTVAEIHEAGADAQAVGGSTGPGPFKIVNNTLEASGENVMFGGADPAIPDLVPSDIEIRGNHIVKPLTWMKGHASYAGTEWTIKNLLELKNARRVVIDGNLCATRTAAPRGRSSRTSPSPTTSCAASAPPSTSSAPTTCTPAV